MINYYFRSIKEDSLQNTSDSRPGTWVCVEHPTDDELDKISEKFGLNRDLLKDAVDVHEVPRFEVENEISYFFTRFPHKSNNERTATILIAVTPTEVITVSNEHPLIFDEYLNNKTPLITTQRTKLFLLLISANNKGYYNELVTIGRKIQRSRVNLHKIKNKDITMLVELESTLNEYINALMSSTSAIKKILSGNHLKLYDEDKDIIEDIQLEKQQQLETAKTNLKTIQNIRNAYTTIISNNLNSVIKLLTSLTIILTIPTIISSMYGMNVKLPFSDYEHAFSAISITAILIMAFVTFIFIKKDWI
jgi:magnesium transporter